MVGRRSALLGNLKLAIAWAAKTIVGKVTTTTAEKAAEVSIAAPGDKFTATECSPACYPRPG